MWERINIGAGMSALRSSQLDEPVRLRDGVSDSLPEAGYRDDLAALFMSAQWALMLGPLVGFALILSVAGIVGDPGAVSFLLSVAVGTFVGGGKLVILAGAVDQAPVGHWELAALVVYIDVATALGVLGGMQHFYRIPWVGQRLNRARRSSARLLRRNPWMHRMAFLTLVGFVAIPLNGTGALVGAFLGRLMGLRRSAIVVATACGSTATAVTLALASGLSAEHINALVDRPYVGLIAVALVLTLTVAISRWALAGGHAGSGGNGG
jgi:uncharacterized membrane protein